MNAVLWDVLLDFRKLKASFLPIHSALPPCPTLQSVRRKDCIRTTLLAAFWRLFAQLEGTFSSVLHSLREGEKEGAEVVEGGRGIAVAENRRRVMMPHLPLLFLSPPVLLRVLTFVLSSHCIRRRWRQLFLILSCRRIALSTQLPSSPRSRAS